MVIKNKVPIITCKPWKPVATKKVEPYTESEIQNEASIYSIAWRAVKYKPNTIVNKRPCFAWVKLFSTIEWWAQVTVTPDLNKIVVFNKGIWKGLKDEIPLGGQTPPNSIVGLNLLWKNAQKNEKKNKTSEVINKIIPHRRPFTTLIVCNPCKNPSRDTSRHHWILDNKIIIIPKKNIFIKLRWNHFTNPDVIIKAPKEEVKGQGLFSTKW